MRVDAFDFDLPEERIALRPVTPRDASKLLVVGPEGNLADHVFSELGNFLSPGDVLVFNDTKVVPVQLSGTRDRDGMTANISATLHTRISGNRWLAFVKGARKLAIGDRVQFGGDNPACFSGSLDGEVTAQQVDGSIEFTFDLSGPVLDEAIAATGTMPLPPYIASRRAADERDLSDYQTVYARDEGAVAAPTAGLHFTPGLLDRLKKNGISNAFVTLHVGPGTFLPVKVDDTDDHKMHTEIGVISEAAATTLNEARRKGGRIVCVGTTSMRLIESAAREDGSIEPWQGGTDIFIVPGYRFKAVDMLITNFHLPKSTLFMLVSAFSGLETMRKAYAHAIENHYRFYSYGDASLLYRAP